MFQQTSKRIQGCQPAAEGRPAGCLDASIVRSDSGRKTYGKEEVTTSLPSPVLVNRELKKLSKQLADGLIQSLQLQKDKLEEAARLRVEVDSLMRHTLSSNIGSNLVLIVADTVAKEFGEQLADILGRRRPAQFMVPRNAVYYLCHHLTGLSTTQIGMVLDGRDHGTIINGIYRTRCRMETEPKFMERIDALEKRCRAALEVEAVRVKCEGVA